MTLPQGGALGFGLVLGWFLYFVNRYRRTDASFADLTTIIGAVGGGAITALFGPGASDLFGAYGVGLAIGFFAYFFVLVILVAISKNFDSDYFLDGRRKLAAGDYVIPAQVKQPDFSFDQPSAPPDGATAKIPPDLP
jgi:hypothetical protein